MSTISPATSTGGSLTEVGQTIQVAVQVRTTAGVAADAGGMTLTVTGPDGSTSLPAVTARGAGLYEAAVTLGLVGRHTLAWVATGANAGRFTDILTAEDASALVVSLDEVKAHLNISSTAHDGELRRLVAVACAAGESYTGRVFGRRTVTDTFDGGLSGVILRRLPVLAVSTVTEGGTAVGADGYRLDPAGSGVLTRAASGWPSIWQPGLGTVQVTYTAGYASQPASDRQGVLEMVRHLWETQRGTLAAMPRGAGLDDYNPGTGYSIPNRVKELWDFDAVPGFA